MDAKLNGGIGLDTKHYDIKSQHVESSTSSESFQDTRRASGSQKFLNTVRVKSLWTTVNPLSYLEHISSWCFFNVNVDNRFSKYFACQIQHEYTLMQTRSWE